MMFIRTALGALDVNHSTKRKQAVRRKDGVVRNRIKVGVTCDNVNCLSCDVTCLKINSQVDRARKNFTSQPVMEAKDYSW